MRAKISIGLLFSTTGTYSAMGREALDGALFAFEEANSQVGGAFDFVPVIVNPAGDLDAYQPLAKRLLVESDCHHLIGTITSAARKEVIPTIEKYDGLLWYTCPYEGSESNQNVIYAGSSPNQHLVPLMQYMLQHHGRRVYLVGSNYIWGWEINRIARSLVQAAGGVIVGEKYLGSDAAETRQLTGDVQAKRPDFILNNLVGTVGHRFLKDYHALGQADPAFHPHRCPVASCNLSECDLPFIGVDASLGLIALTAFLATVDTPEAIGLRRRMAQRFGGQRTVSVYFTNSYRAAWGLIQAARRAGTDEVNAVRAAVHQGPLSTPLGALVIDPTTQHAEQPWYVSHVTAESRFRILAQAPPVPADPYLARLDLAAFARMLAPPVAALR